MHQESDGPADNSTAPDSGSAGAAPSKAESQDQDLTILIVDDNELDRELLFSLLQKRTGFRILQAESGTQAWQVLESQPVEVLLLDLILPDVRGAELIEKIRGRWSRAELPILMISANQAKADLIKCLSAGANDYITKPIDLDVTLSRVRTASELTLATRQLMHIREIHALDAMITTFNHEINNPLSIAIAVIDHDDYKGVKTYKMLNDALWRISQIVKKISAVTEEKELKFERYAKSSQMISLGGTAESTSINSKFSG